MKRNKALWKANLFSALFASCFAFVMCNTEPRIPLELQDKISIDKNKYIEQARDTMFVLSHKN